MHPQGATRIRLAGALEVELDGARIEDRLRGAQGRLLLAYLVRNRDRHVSRDELASALWGDAPPPTPGALAPPLSRLRRAVGADRLTGRIELRLDLGEDAWVDVEAAERAVREAGAVLADDPRRASDLANRALGVFDRRLLPGLEAAWLDEWRFELEARRVEALELVAAAGAALPATAHADAERAARAAVELAPFRESAWVGLLSVLRARGNVSEGLRAFEDARVLLRDELGAAPGPALLTAHAELLAAMDEEPDTVALPSIRTHVLPAVLTPIVGREDETRDVAALLLRADVRLVTLAGPGGIGKSRLAYEVAAQVADRFADGVQVVTLASTRDARLVPDAIAAQLGLRGEATPREQLIAHLRARHLVLLLDNFEQVADAAPLIAELLAAAPGVKALVTSQTILRVQGEHVVAVEPLALPNGGDPASAAAVRLFAERARAADPRFALTAATTPAVVQIVRRLDGLPLAIELAAARIRLLTAQALLDRLDDRFAVLTSGMVDAPERQQTLERMIAWSHELLEPRERALLRRLGVFPGYFDLEAAEAVAGVPDLVGTLGSLVDKSLVRSLARRGRPVFGMLETIREYAAHRLEEAGELELVRDRHAAHFLARARAAEAPLRGPGQPELLVQLEDDRGDLRTALSWLVSRGRPEEAIQLGWGVWMMWWLNGHLEEGHTWFVRLAGLSGGLDAYPRARALAGAGLMGFARGEHEAAREALSRSLELYREAADDEGVAVSAGALGLIVALAGDPERGTQLIDESIALYTRLGDDWFRATMLTFAGVVASSQGDCARAATAFAEAVRIARDVDDTLPLLLSLYDLAVSRWSDGDRPGARELFLEGVSVAARASDTGSTGTYLAALADVWIDEDPTHAALLHGAATSCRTAAGRGNWLDAWVIDHPERATLAAVLRDRLGDEALSAAMRRGAALGGAGAVRYALAYDAVGRET